MPKDDWIRVQHMLDAGRQAEDFARGRSRADLDHDRLLGFGLLKCIEIVGEAAAHVSEELRSQYPLVPWKQLVAMRNRIVHVYFDIDRDQVWKAVTEDIPPLLGELEKILFELKKDQDLKR